MKNFFVVTGCILSSFLLSAQQPKLVLPVGHTDMVNFIEFSPDRKKIVTAADDKTAKIWDAATGKLLADLKGHTGKIKSLSFNHTGKRILTSANLDTVVKLWDAETGYLIRNLTDRNYNDLAMFSPDGSMIIVSTSSGTAFLLSAETGLPLMALQTQNKGIQKAAFSFDGKRLITLSRSRIPELYELPTGNLVANLAGHSSFVNTVGFTPDGNKVITTSYDNTIKIWDAKTGFLQLTLEGNTEMVVSVTVSPDGTRLSSSTLGSRTAKLWDLQKGSFIADLTGNDYSLKSIYFSQDSKTIFTTGHQSITKAWHTDNGRPLTLPYTGKIITYDSIRGLSVVNTAAAVQIFDNSTGKPITTLENTESLSIAQFKSIDNKISGTGTDKKTVLVWDTRTGRQLTSLKGYTNPVKASFISPGNKHIVTVSPDKTDLWNIQGNLITPVLDFINKSVKHVVYSPDGKYMIQVKENETDEVSLWDAGTLKNINSNLATKGMQNISRYQEGSFVFSEDSKRFFIANNDWGSCVFDARTGKLIKEIMHERVWFSTVNPSITKFISYSENGVDVTDVETGISINKMKLELVSVEPVRFFDESRFLAFTVDNIMVWSATEKKPVLTIPNGQYLFNADKTLLLVWQYDMLRIWDLKTYKLQAEIKASVENSIWDATWSFDEKFVLYSTNMGDLVMADAQKGTSITKRKGYAINLDKSRNGNYYFGINEELVSIYTADNLQTVAELIGHTNRVIAVVLLPDSTKVLTLSEDNTGKVWELPSGKLLYSFLMMGRDYAFNITPGGYYMANPKASKLLHYTTPDLKIISFEQLDVKYNRPDKVLEAIGTADTGLIRSYRKAWEKRIRKLGVDTTTFKEGYSVPSADFVNRDDTQFERTDESVQLHIKGIDSVYKLDRFNIWINEVPLYGQRGVRLKKRYSNSFDTTVSIKLTRGENRIETSVTNVNGTESYRMPLVVNYTAAVQPKQTTRFVGIGIDEFTDSQYNLKYSAKDIRDLALKLKEKYKDDIIIDTLFNKNVTISNVKSLKKKLLQTTENDKVIIAYSGHGMLSKEYDYYLSTYSVNFDKPEENGLPYEELENLLDSIPARKKLMLIDACHSGEVDKEDLVTLNASSDSLIKGLKPVAYKKDGQLGLKNSFELMQSLFVNVGKSTGATIISAAAGTQFALERNDLKNGVFTYCILEAMNKYPSLKISELKKIVGERVEELTKGLQKPTSRNETIAVDWSF
ncbi:MAG: caspase family protein [Bacteroidota bacterium]|nr:caspase family protein [Bacteroidota bacterium]